MNTKAIGDFSEAMIIASLLRNGTVILKPVGDNQRYDFVIAEGTKFVRVQCKTGRLRKGAIRFWSSSSYAHRGRGKRDYKGDADLFGVFCPENGICYLVPVDEVGARQVAIRVDQTKNSQSKNVRFAKDFEISH